MAIDIQELEKRLALYLKIETKKSWFKWLAEKNKKK